MPKRISVGNKLNILLFSAMLGVMAISALALYSNTSACLTTAAPRCKAWCK